MVIAPNAQPGAAASAAYRLLPTVDDAYREMLAAIEGAAASVRLEMYIYTATPVGERFRDALVAARERGADVRVLLDSFGSMNLPESFWSPLTAAGGRVRWFNPMTLRRFAFRNHRKSLTCDDAVAFVGGFNVSTEYAGDGVERGWHDVGLRVHGRLATEIAASFDRLFERADVPHRRLARLRRTDHKQRIEAPEGELLLGGPGLARNPLRCALLEDLARSADVTIASAYFLPPRAVRRALRAAARDGRRGVLILAGKSDVAIAQLATRALYSSLLRAGVEVYEYQPQVLHSKLFVLDDVVYAGSANLNLRSLHIDYELMIRVADRTLAEEARAVLRRALALSRRIELRQWQAGRSLWARIVERCAYFLIARVDPLIAGRQLESLRQREAARHER